MSTSTDLLDPLQGFDIKVTVQAHAGTGAGAASATSSGQLIGAFTSLMFKIINQTETYLPLNSRFPRMLDGEIIVVWALEQGMVSLDVVRNTFGGAFADALDTGRGVQAPRQQRFQIIFQTNLAGADITSMATSDVGFHQDKTRIINAKKYTLNYCRVDTCTFGVAAGRHVVANTWNGTAQNISKLN